MPSKRPPLLFAFCLVFALLLCVPAESSAQCGARGSRLGERVFSQRRVERRRTVLRAVAPPRILFFRNDRG